MAEALTRSQLGVVILAGGEASRLPHKLELNAGDVPMIVRVYKNVSLGRETYISCKSTFPPEIDELLPCPMVVDSLNRPGPLGGLLSTIGEMSTPYIFAVAGDAPFIDSSFIDDLAAHWQAGDEAIVWPGASAASCDSNRWPRSTSATPSSAPASRPYSIATARCSRRSISCARESSRARTREPSPT